MAKRRSTNKEKTKKKAGRKRPRDRRLYALEVSIMSGPMTEEFAKRNPEVSRTIQIRGDQTLAHLHEAIFDAFGRYEEHMYEFQLGKGPHDPEGESYVLPMVAENPLGLLDEPAGLVTRTTVGSLGLKVGQAFGYWFDYGDDWWHQLKVVAIEEAAPPGTYPKVTKQVGESPPQYMWEEDEEDDDEEDDEEEEED